jgi:hypothetical protein
LASYDVASTIHESLPTFSAACKPKTPRDGNAAAAAAFFSSAAAAFT